MVRLICLWVNALHLSATPTKAHHYYMSIPLLLTHILYTIHIKNVSCDVSRLAALQGSRACQLINTVIKNDNLLAADASGVDATCTAFLQQNDEYSNCVVEVRTYVWCVQICLLNNSRPLCNIVCALISAHNCCNLLHIYHYRWLMLFLKSMLKAVQLLEGKISCYSIYHVAYHVAH